MFTGVAADCIYEVLLSYTVLLLFALEPVTKPVDVVQELGLSAGEIGELVITGWHVNTFHVSYTALAQLHVRTFRDSKYSPQLVILAEVEYVYSLWSLISLHE